MVSEIHIWYNSIKNSNIYEDHHPKSFFSNSEQGADNLKTLEHFNNEIYTFFRFPEAGKLELELWFC